MQEAEDKSSGRDEMAAIGALLRDTRLKQGLSLEAVQEETKIRCYYLEALETGDTQVIPGEVYLKGFLRNYAQFLGLPGDELVARYVKSRTPEVEHKVVVPSGAAAAGHGRPRGVMLAASLLLILVVASCFLLARTPERNQFPSAQEQPSAEVPAPGTAAPEVETPLPGAKETTATEVITLKDETREALYQVWGNESEIQALIEVVGERCWVAVRLDDGAEYSETLKRGDIRSLRARDKVWLRAGDPGALELTIAGVSFGRAGEPGVPRNLTIERAP